ncbi:MAG: hydantoinase/oxoprolinase family protein, partial [Syntrophaceticus sp.]|nr:hydantoinase/oxoprolinase family protein [Syntrophaceticus sp.]
EHFDVQDERGAMYFVDKILQFQEKEIMDCSLDFNLPLIAIGAPVQAYLPDVAKKLGLELNIPGNAEIANAIGAASGNIVEVVQVLIQPDGDERFIVFAPWERIKFEKYGEALDYALTEASKRVAEQVEKSGAAEYEISTNKEESFAEGWNMFVETRITVTAVGKPKWV